MIWSHILASKREFDEVEELIAQSRDVAAEYDSEIFIPDSFQSTQQDLSDRQALRRVIGLSTELTDISEAEYRQLRLEKVILVGVWTEGSVKDAENSMECRKLYGGTCSPCGNCGFNRS
ncbi:MAG: GTPase [Actinomycetota bacterium]